MFLPLLLVATALQTEMTPQEKKSTGLYKLNQRERGALQRWIEANYSAKTVKEAPAQKSLLEENLQDGRYIRLKDGTTWEIRPEDTPITQAWITPVDIAVSSNDDPVYSYTLTNTLTKSSVRAQKVSAVPRPLPTTPPQPTKGK